MAMYALGMSVLQDVIAFEKTKVKQVAYADDLSGAGKLQDLSHWWGLIQANGPTIGYTPNAAKSFLIVKPEHYDGAVNIFSGSGVVVTKEGQRHLGAVIGTEEYKKEYVGEKVSEWVHEVDVLSAMAKTEPHAAYAAYTHGLQHRWNFAMRTIPDISPLLRPLEESIKNTFIPALLRSPVPGNDARALLELPPRLGGMGITSPEKVAEVENLNSINLTRSLTDMIIAQDAQGEIDQSVIAEQKKRFSRDRQQGQKTSLEHLSTILPPDTVRKIHIAQETGASNWLTSLPSEQRASTSTNRICRCRCSEVRLASGRTPQHLCVWIPNNVDHTMTCKKGGIRVYQARRGEGPDSQHAQGGVPRRLHRANLLPLEGNYCGTGQPILPLRLACGHPCSGILDQRAADLLDIRIFDPMAASHRRALPRGCPPQERAGEDKGLWR
ncbi:hypothetical protein GWK47_044105 [Chionoecetes opilio]|uniref:Uncharacterized protein n=1 Tax=Chionoecetes opilio TaxID=41210 RepID=A0A8J4YGW9_CHIOP|nr:hypothetical protein GWK47_044105 [Chionoecetes opilio]